MSNSEFENGFNILYNNILSGQSPGINSYEKSFFLTKAQEEIVKNYFNPLGNKYQDGVEGSPKRNIDFSSIIRERSITGSFIPFGRIYDNMLVYELPEDYFLELSLRLRSVPQQGQQLLHRVIKNVTSMEMDRLQSKPYREPFRAQAWKVHTLAYNGKDSEFNIVINKNDVAITWLLDVRYVKRLKPIILEDLSITENEFGLSAGTLTIEGESQAMACELDSQIHQEVLNRAVELAALSMTNDKLAPMLQVNARSE